MVVKQLLMTFDFDRTIIHRDSDDAIIALHPTPSTLPQQPLHPTPSTLPQQPLFATQCDYMNKVLGDLHASGVSKSDILRTLENLSFTRGFKQLLHFASGLDADVIIISDSNRVFIEHFLKHHQLRSLFCGLFTNHGHFDLQGRLLVSHYHRQENCQLSSVNLCKGRVLEDFVKDKELAGVQYQRVAYVGDGDNDYCPSLRLSARDIVFARKKYDLETRLSSASGLLEASVVPWEDGFDIIEKLRTLL